MSGSVAGNVEIHHGDTLKNDWDWLRDPNPAHKPQFDAVVANPPFSLRWEPEEAAAQDPRFANSGVAPRSAADGCGGSTSTLPLASTLRLCRTCSAPRPPC